MRGPHANGTGDVCIIGVFDTGITELLPRLWDLAKADARH